jgi:hypothetical protein
MGTITSTQISNSMARPAPTESRRTRTYLLVLFALWLAIFGTALIGPPLLDDADATHAQAAQAMLDTGDWVTLHVDGIRYLEKPPLPYWIAAVSLKLFPTHPAFAIHLPLALTVLGLALLGYAWSRRAFSPLAAFYTGLFILTSAGTFLFTRIFIPDALLSLLLAIALYALLRSLEASTNPGAPFMRSVIAHERDADISAASVSTAFAGAPCIDSPPPLGAPFIRGFIADEWDANIPGGSTFYPYILWLSLALAVLTKGLVALVFFFGTALIFMTLTRELHHWRRLKPFTGILLFLAIAAPWHILAGLRNTGAANGHGFFWFYFINEHVLRFLGRRIPRDYNKLPTALYWSQHLVWLFPWSLFAPTAIATAWRNRTHLLQEFPIKSALKGTGFSPYVADTVSARALAPERQDANATTTNFTRHTILLLIIFSTLVLIFFSLSTNQEYYTLPVYLPLLMLLAAALTSNSSLFPLPFSLFFTLGLAIAAALAYGLWTSRHLPYVPDIGSLLAHRGVGDYTLSMSHFFDLTGPSFAALRLPATLAAIAFTIGPATAWLLHARRKPEAAILTVALTSAVFLIAAHIALLRFAPMLSSQNFAATIQRLEREGNLPPDTQIYLFGDQAYGSSLPFYLHRQAYLVDGRSTSMLFGSTFPDAPNIFLTSTELASQWGQGPRKILFVPLELRDQVDHLLGPGKTLLQEESGKALYTDRTLTPNP